MMKMRNNDYIHTELDLKIKIKIHTELPDSLCLETGVEFLAIDCFPDSWIYWSKERHHYASIVHPVMLKLSANFSNKFLRTKFLLCYQKIRLFSLTTSEGPLTPPSCQELFPVNCYFASPWAWKTLLVSLRSMYWTTTKSSFSPLQHHVSDPEQSIEVKQNHWGCETHNIWRLTKSSRSKPKDVSWLKLRFLQFSVIQSIWVMIYIRKTVLHCTWVSREGLQFFKKLQATQVFYLPSKWSIMQIPDGPRKH